MKFKSVDEILDFAIEKEEEAASFYTDLAGRVEQWNMAQVFEDFAKEEKKHKEKLLKIKDGKLLLSAAGQVKDLKISDYLVEVPASPELGYQGALILAMKKEKASFKLYSDLAASAPDENLRATLSALAQEEARHKLRLEVEYDEHFLSEN
jgi:rubrerythrin